MDSGCPCSVITQVFFCTRWKPISLNLVRDLLPAIFLAKHGPCYKLVCILTFSSCSSYKSFVLWWNFTTRQQKTRAAKEFLGKRNYPMSAYLEGKGVWNHCIQTIGHAPLPEYSAAGFQIYIFFPMTWTQILANSSCGSSLVCLRQKIDKNNPAPSLDSKRS